MSINYIIISSMTDLIITEMNFLQSHPMRNTEGFQKKLTKLCDALISDDISDDDIYDLLLSCPGCKYC